MELTNCFSDLPDTLESISFRPNLTKLHEIQLNTLTEIRYMLHTFNKCAVVRPTGFGKTYIASKIIADYNRILYVYPTDVLVQDVQTKYPEFNTDKVEFLSYIMFGKLGNSQDLLDAFKSMDYDLVIFDEMHRMGACNFKNTMLSLIDNGDFDDVNILGLTATPWRLDNYNIISDMFDDHQVFKYTMHDAIQDGILPKPFYVLGLVDIAKTMNNAVNFEGTSGKDIDEAMNVFSTTMLEMSNKLNASEIINRNIVKCYGATPNYMKFIVFFSRIDRLYNKEDDIEGWFKEAFPNMQINTLTITSRNDDRQNIAELPNLMARDNTIDLILTVNMLNVGYHVDDVTGVVMLRSTGSATVYTQQIGRSLSITSKCSPIVFDFVDNYNRDYFYNLEVTKPKTSKSTESEEIEDSEDQLADSIFTAQDVILVDSLVDYREIINNKVLLPVRKSIDRQLWEVRVNCNLSDKECYKLFKHSLTMNYIQEFFNKWNI